MLAEAETLMRQGGMTAEVWMVAGKRFVEEHFAEYPLEARATLIAAYVTAAAGDQLGMYVRGLAEATADRS
jgi:hypothetical protein